jgi:hypothetical protein
VAEALGLRAAKIVFTPVSSNGLARMRSLNDGGRYDRSAYAVPLVGEVETMDGWNGTFRADSTFIGGRGTGNSGRLREHLERTRRAADGKRDPAARFLTRSPSGVGFGIWRGRLPEREAPLAF